MTEFELTSLVFDLFRDMDSMIEFWITATFAVVVAVFAANEYLSTKMTKVILALYITASILFALRWALFLYRTLHYREVMLEQFGRDIATNWALVTIVATLTVIIFFVGVITACYFLLKESNSSDKSTAEL
ncbi:MAG: hypothetical protein V2I33_08010 [Kangiellaceae bacterium]|nr:hypothetical protein [Kangiellaceae bacterium]